MIHFIKMFENKTIQYCFIWGCKHNSNSIKRHRDGVYQIEYGQDLWGKGE